MKDERDFISPEQFMAIYRHCLTTNREREALLFRTAFETSKRVSEIVGAEAYSRHLLDRKTGKEFVRHYAPIRGLRPIDIDAVRGAIFFELAKKRGQDRPIEPAYVSPELCLLLKSYADRLKIPPTVRIFPLSSSYLRRLTPKIAAAAGVFLLGEKDPHFHSFRQGALLHMASQPDARPLDVEIVRAQAGHSTADTTLWYFRHVAQEQKHAFSAERMKSLGLDSRALPPPIPAETPEPLPAHNSTSAEESHSDKAEAIPADAASDSLSAQRRRPILPESSGSE